MINEVREYVPMPGRLGDAMDLLKTTVFPLFRRHNMKVVQAGFTTLGDHSFGEIVYTMRFENLAELEEKWNAFLADPDWAPALAAREKDGPLYKSIKRRVLNADPFEDALPSRTDHSPS